MVVAENHSMSSAPFEGQQTHSAARCNVCLSEKQLVVINNSKPSEKRPGRTGAGHVRLPNLTRHLRQVFEAFLKYEKVLEALIPLILGK